jgi:hypothetical protein
MKCEHISKAKPGEKPFPDGYYGFWQLQCAKCGMELGDILNMTEKQKKMDKEYTIAKRTKTI